MTKTYTEREVELIKTEERFITYLVLASADIRLKSQPAQYREARERVGHIVATSKKYDQDTKSKFALFLTLIDNCVPVQDRPLDLVESYNKVIADILAPGKTIEDPDDS